MNVENSILGIRNLPKIIDKRGNLSFIEGLHQIPFEIKRIYWIYDVPGGDFRGSHAFREQEEFIVALSGSFDVVVNDGEKEYKYSLNRSYYGIYIPKMKWRQLENFSTNSLCMVLSSMPYNPDDYIWDFEVFKQELTIPFQSTITIPEHKMVTENYHHSTIHDCFVKELPQFHDPAGNLTALNNWVDLPFEIKRIFYIYDIPSGACRGAHAHRDTYQLIVAASSSFDLFLDDGHEQTSIRLDQPNKGLLVKPGIWCRLQNFSSASVCLVMTSDIYRSDEYLNDYQDFLVFKSCK